MATNWAGNITFSTVPVRPRSVVEVQELVASAERVKVLGTGHSFNRVADSSGTLVNLRDLPKVIEPDQSSVTISAGLRYGEVTPVLQRAGLALHNLGSLPHIAVAGACSTGTHGSGDLNRPLAAAVSELTMVDAAGEVVSLKRGDAEFAGSVIALGALGVVVELRLDVQPSYQVRQVVYDGLPGQRLAADLGEILAGGYSVSAFTDWVDPAVMVWRKMLADQEYEESWLGATIADGPRHPIRSMPADYATHQGGVVGPWNERLPHFRMEFTPSNGDELQSEYFLPRETAGAAIEALWALGKRMAPVLQVGEVRSIAADDLWLSPSQGRDTVALHFTWVQDEAAVLPVVEAVERALLPLGARPHWGKVFTADAGALRECYPMLDRFVELTRRYDAAGKFRNDYLDKYLPR